MQVHVLTIGDELLSGHVVDTNFTRIANWVTSRGHEVRSHSTVGDDPDEIGRELVRALAGADLVVVTGGLGPTPDDRTVDAAARALGRSVIESPEVVAKLEAMYRRAGRPMRASTRRIARVVEGSVLFDNPVGQAPAQWIDGGKGAAMLLPGVPRELEGLLAAGFGDRVPVVKGAGLTTFRTVGVPESTLSETLGGRGFADVAFLPWAGGVDVRVPSARAEALRAVLADTIGDAYLEGTSPRLERRVVHALAARGKTLAVAESVTGGALAAAIVSVPGASEVFEGGVVAYANAVKQSLLGVPVEMLRRHGAVSEPVAVRMAQGVRERFGTTWGVATSGIAGPAGATPDKPIGLVCFGLAGPDGTSGASYTFAGDRRGITERSVVRALDLLRRAIAGRSLR